MNLINLPNYKDPEFNSLPKHSSRCSTTPAPTVACRPTGLQQIQIFVEQEGAKEWTLTSSIEDALAFCLVTIQQMRLYDKTRCGPLSHSVCLSLILSYIKAKSFSCVCVCTLPYRSCWSFCLLCVCVCLCGTLQKLLVCVFRQSSVSIEMSLSSVFTLVSRPVPALPSLSLCLLSVLFTCLR